MTTFKFGVKLFITNPSARALKDFIPVFHGWIQRQALPGHMLLDVHDYSHVHHGPGILLVAHEANLGIDEAEGRRGLVYTRKQAGDLAGTLAAAGQAARLLTEELGVQFQTGQFEIFVNDRLASVTAAEIAAATKGTAVLKVTDPRERPTFVVTVG